MNQREPSFIRRVILNQREKAYKYAVYVDRPAKKRLSIEIVGAVVRTVERKGW